jgi:hypothetical protein
MQSYARSLVLTAALLFASVLALLITAAPQVAGGKPAADASTRNPA